MILKLGSSGTAVSNLQKNLNEIGDYKIAVDGDFNQKTLNAVLDFQRSRNIDVDGIVGPITQREIVLALVKKATTPVDVSDKIERDAIAKEFIGRLEKLVKLPVREDSGKNRSKIIDAWNKRVGAKLGSPYCASSVWCEWSDFCKDKGLVFPMEKTASSQFFVSGVPSKYRRKDGELGRIGDAAVLQNSNDTGHGHLTTVRENQSSQPYFLTHEFNTNEKGSRDGEGGYSLKRSTIDFSSHNSGKLFRAFVDIPQWIVDANKK